MRCFECGKGQLKTQETTVSAAFRGSLFDVRTVANVCPKCGYKSIPAKHADNFGVALADAYRRKHDLLTSTQLKEIRKELDLTQEEFATYLHVGVASVKRWEGGLGQDRAMDQLIRLRTDPFVARRNYEQLSRRLARRVA